MWPCVRVISPKAGTEMRICTVVWSMKEALVEKWGNEMHRGSQSRRGMLSKPLPLKTNET